MAETESARQDHIEPDDVSSHSELSDGNDFIIIVKESVTRTKSHVANANTNTGHLTKLPRTSEYFRTMLRGRWAEPSADVVTLHDDKLPGIEIWLRHIHSKLDVVPGSEVSIADVWHVIVTGDKYQFDLRGLQAWFNLFAAQMVFPCWAFDYARGFQNITKALAYHASGQIEGINLTEMRNAHLPPRIIQQLNAARGRLRNILHHGLFTRANEIVRKATCDCKEKTIFNYLEELDRIEVPRLEQTIYPMVSVQKCRTRLARFDEQQMLGNGSPKPYCPSCMPSWKVNVEQAIQNTSQYFDGLCLDYLDLTTDRQATRGLDDDY
ncbi:hypothetical protein BBP40_002962 [Aspergillus hancockii]|nr:hypothetical protein BBP40_002962 [Aspergillus hancockii]